MKYLEVLGGNLVICQNQIQYLLRKQLNYVKSTGINIKFICSVNVGAVSNFQKNPVKCVSPTLQKTADANMSTSSSIVEQDEETAESYYLFLKRFGRVAHAQRLIKTKKHKKRSRLKQTSLTLEGWLERCLKSVYFSSTTSESCL